MKFEDVTFYRNPANGEIKIRLHEEDPVPEEDGKPLIKLVAKTADLGLEKHVPVVEKVGDKLLVKCGEVPHPMTKEHHIEFLALVYEEKGEAAVDVEWLDPEQEAKCDFEFAEHGIAYAYCNLHGFWKNEF